MRILSWLAMAAVLVALPAAGASGQTVVLVRHAEKAPAPSDDPVLSSEGSARALALADALGGAHVDVVITTQYRRTRDTAAPAAAIAGITPAVARATGDTAAHARAVAEMVRRHPPTSVVLVVGHSNTIPAIVEALGGPRLPELCDASYAQFFTLVLRHGAPPSLIRSTYGRADVPDSRCEGGMMQR